MQGIPEDSIDSIVTDPPYGLKFMGKVWDHGVPGIPFWQECLRVSKPGAHMLAFGGTRTHHRLMVAIEDAGWEIRDTLMWVYGSGFPKSLDVSKAIDKSYPRHGLFERFALHFREQRKIKDISQKEIAICFPSKTGGLTGCVWNWENAMNVPTMEQWTILHPLLDLSKEFLPLIERIEAERKIVGKGFRIDRHTSSVPYGSGTPDGEYNLTVPTTDAAKQWNGWGTALKPAWEPIILCRKPLEGTVSENVQKWGTGGINIDGCRVALNGDKPRIANIDESYTNTYGWAKGGIQKSGTMPQSGRFPANLIHDGSDEVLASFPDSKGQCGDVRGTEPSHTGDENTSCYGEYQRIATSKRNDNGSAARFFYSAKADTEERNKYLKGKPFQKVNDGRDTPIDNAFQRGETMRKNIHPTVKPIDLLQYLCRLITPPKGLILDPFAGSGSTGIAAHNEGFDYLLIEIEQEYADIARMRNAQVRLPT